MTAPGVAVPEFRFDANDHTYWLGDVRLIGVSEAIQAAGLKSFDGIRPETLERARLRGIAVHAACHYLDDGDLNWKTVSPEIEPFVRGWERFKADTGFVADEIEAPIFDPTRGVAGTPDRIGRFPGSHVRAVVDIKTYAPDDVTGVQTAAYGLIRFDERDPFSDRVYEAHRRLGVWLKGDGTYGVREFGEGRDSSVFLAALAIAQFKRGMKS